jgi:hypothetical protein
MAGKGQAVELHQLNHLVLCHARLDQEALTGIEQALTITRAENNTFEIAFCQLMAAYALTRMQRYAEAVRLAELAERHSSNTLGFQLLYWGLAVLSCGLSRPTDVRIYIQAGQLIIGAGMVKTHTLTIYRKLEVANRTQAIVRAQEVGLLRV